MNWKENNIAMGADGAAVNLRYKGGVIALQAEIGSLFHFTACHTGRFPFIISDNGKLRLIP